MCDKDKHLSMKVQEDAALHGRMSTRPSLYATSLSSQPPVQS
jgi:hypothetical protein